LELVGVGLDEIDDLALVKLLVGGVGELQLLLVNHGDEGTGGSSSEHGLMELDIFLDYEDEDLEDNNQCTQEYSILFWPRQPFQTFRVGKIPEIKCAF